MTFISNHLLWFLLAAFLPVIIHLLNRRRHKTIQWAAMQFLLKATRESRGKKKLRHILILTCRTLGVAALALAAARPVTGKLFGWGSGNLDCIVLILDRSASMETTADGTTETRRILALDRVKDAMKSISSTRLVLIDSATGTPQEVPSPEILPEIISTQATSTEADMPSLLQRAADFILETRPGKTEIWIASDLQYSDWQKENERWLTTKASLTNNPQKTNIRIISLNSPCKTNASLKILSCTRIADSLQIELELMRSSDSTQPINMPLTSSLNGVKTTDSVTLTGQTLHFTKRVKLPPKSNQGMGWLSIPYDANPQDNVVHFSYGEATPPKTLLVARSSESAKYFAMSAAPENYQNQKVEIIAPEQWSAKVKNPSDYSAIIWTTVFPDESIASELLPYIENGGAILFSAPTENSKNTLFHNTWQPIITAPEGKFFILKDWNKDDGLMKNTPTGTVIAGQTLKAIRRQIPEGKNLVPLAIWDDGSIFLAREVMSKGTAYYLATTPDYTWSNLADAHILLPLVQRLIAQGNARYDFAHLSIVGSSELQVKNAEVLTKIDDYPTEQNTVPNYSSGTFRIAEKIISANLPAGEYDPQALTKSDLVELFHNLPFSTMEDKSTHSAATSSYEIWRFFLYALLFLLVSEALLCLPKKQH